MLKRINKYISDRFMNWASSHHYRLIVFNMILVFLFLLRSAGYFNPYFPITVNVIVFVGLVLAIFILDANSKSLFAVSISFWVFAALLKLLNINVWAERTSIYVYESIFLGIILVVIESFSRKKT
jgi:hypothetical protein